MNRPLGSIANSLRDDHAEQARAGDHVEQRRSCRRLSWMIGNRNTPSVAPSLPAPAANTGACPPAASAGIHLGRQRVGRRVRARVRERVEEREADHDHPEVGAPPPGQRPRASPRIAEGDRHRRRSRRAGAGRGRPGRRATIAITNPTDRNDVEHRRAFVAVMSSIRKLVLAPWTASAAIRVGVKMPTP